MVDQGLYLGIRQLFQGVHCRGHVREGCLLQRVKKNTYLGRYISNRLGINSQLHFCLHLPSLVLASVSVNLGKIGKPHTRASGLLDRNGCPNLRDNGICMGILQLGFYLVVLLA